MVGMVLAFALGAAAAVAASVAVVVLGLQWVTTYPFRWGWRAHSQPIGVQLPDGDPRLETKPRRISKLTYDPKAARPRRLTEPTAPRARRRLKG
jgi:hypothetical protein